MKRILLIAATFLLSTGLPGYAPAGKLPIIDGKKAVASVNEEPITLDELNQAVAASHAERADRSGDHSSLRGR